jgi:DNA mismatch repair protein MutS
VAVREWQGQVIFLHKITSGKADKSYGIYVAQLAGVPAPVHRRAAEILIKLEAEHLDENGRPKLAAKKPKKRATPSVPAQQQGQQTLFDL